MKIYSSHLDYFLFSTFFIISNLDPCLLPYYSFGKPNAKSTLKRHLSLLTSRWSVNIKTYLSQYILLKTGGLFWSLRNPTFFEHHSTCQIRTEYFRIKNTKYTFMNLWLYTFSLLLLSWQESTLCEQDFTWYQSPDEGYRNKNVKNWLSSKINSFHLDYFLFFYFFIIYIYIYISKNRCFLTFCYY